MSYRKCIKKCAKNCKNIFNGFWSKNTVKFNFHDGCIQKKMDFDIKKRKNMLTFMIGIFFQN